MQHSPHINDIVRIKKYPIGDINEKARVMGVYNTKKQVWISNLNMPFIGTVSEIVSWEDIEY